MKNNEVINEHIKAMYENLSILDELKSMPLDQFKQDKKTIKLVEHCLQLSIQSLLDICHYLIAQNSWERAMDNKQAIQILGAKGVIPKDFAQHIEPIANLRNLLIHEYLKIDLERIHKNLQNLEDFRTFSRHILAYIEK